MARFLIRALGAGAATLFALMSLPAQAQTPPPTEAFFYQIRDVEISPDGRYLSMIQPFQGRTALVVYPMGGGEPTLIEPGQRGRGENLEVQNHFWQGDRIVVEVNWNDHYVSRRQNLRVEQTRMISMDPDGGRPQVLFESRQDRESDIAFENNIIDVLDNDPEHVLVSLFDIGGDVGYYSVHKVNINNGRSVVVARGTDNTFGWATDSNGDVLARLDDVDGTFRLYVRDPGDVSWQLLTTRREFTEDGQGNISPIAIIDGWLYVESNHEGSNAIYRINMSTGGNMELVFMPPDHIDVGTLDYSVDEDRLISVSWEGHGPTQYHWFDDEQQELHDRINRLLPGEEEAIIEETDDETMRVIASTSPNEPTIYYLMNDTDGTISEIGQAYPQLGAHSLGEVSIVTYQARDGLEIRGYLILPPGRSMEDGPFPFVMYPHGGPNARDYYGFDDLAQFIATRGYAVFQPNFRGSRGFGNEFMRLGFEQWGGTMQDDLTDGTQYLIDQGIADPDRMCIVGWSYSAYAAAMAAVKTPDLFNCAAGINGVYDLPALQSDLRTSRAWNALGFWENTMGRNEAALARMSPARRADEIRIPMLILASQEDQIAPYEDSVRMIRALNNANVQLESNIYEYGNHSLDYRPNRVDAYNRVANFLAAHIND